MHIDILVNVYDNLGDMGFAYELALHLRRRIPGVIPRFFTDDTGALEQFFLMQGALWEIHNQSKWQAQDHGKTGLFLVLFRTGFSLDMLKSLPDGVTTLWIDYLVFDPVLAALHAQHHLHSSDQHPVYHIVNSPLGGGLLPPHTSIRSHASTTINEWLVSLGERPLVLLPEKIHLIFSYQTYDIIRRIDASHVLNIGFAPISEQQMFDQSGLIMPYVSMDKFYTLFSAADAMIVRGEVSLVGALHSGTPFYWDMYKQKGGWNTLEFEAFLSWISDAFFSLGYESQWREYREASLRLNANYELTSGDMDMLSHSCMHEVFAEVARRAGSLSLLDTILGYLAQNADQ